MPLFDLPTFALVSLTLTALLAGARLLVFKAAAAGSEKSISSAEHLRPAELAYLLRDGDMSNVITVLAFDLLHRAVKSGSESEYPSDLAQYEKKVWLNAKEFVRGWTGEKVDKLLPAPGRESLVLTTRKVSAIYLFLSKNLRVFASEVISDPKRIKRYISFAGVARFVADLAGAGYKQMVSTEMSSELVERGFLVPLEKSRPFAVVLWAIALAGLVATFFSVFAFIPAAPLAIACVLMALVNAAAGRFYMFCLELLPLYVELKDVLAHVKRSGWRLKLVRILLGAFSSVVRLSLTMAICLLLLVECLALKFALGAMLSQVVFVILLLSANCYVVLTLMFEANGLRYRPLLSLAARDILKDEKGRLSHASPVETFGQLLSAPQYNPDFSKLLALYGIETLWLLA